MNMQMTTMEPEGYHFHVMRRALDEIDAAGAALSLDELAAG